MGNNPGQTGSFAMLIVAAAALGAGKGLAGLPPHLRVVRENGEPSNSLRRQFQKGKASAKKRGK